MILTGLKYWSLNVLISLDQLLNTIFLGAPDETISSRAGKARARGSWWGCYLCLFLDWIDPRHCETSREDDEGSNGVLERLKRDKALEGPFLMERPMSFKEYDRFGKPRRWVSRVFIHCSAHDGKHTDDAEVIDRWHKDRGWKGIGYHYFIKFDGTIQVGRPINQIPAAQARHNRGTIAICVHGGQNSKDDAFTNRQFDALLKLCQDIDEAYDGKITFHGHKEVSAKACPVFDYKEVLGLDAKGYLVKGAVNEQKLENAGSKTIKATKSNKDAGGAIVGIGVAGGAAEALKHLKGVSESFGEWRTVINALADGATWLVSHWWLGIVAAGGVVIWNNRKIIKARLSDETKIGRLENATPD